MCYCPTPTLHLNLALTGDGAFLLSLKKTHSVWFISVLNYGDTENVLINHLLLVIPMSYPCHYTNLCPHKPHKHAHTYTHTHTHTHTHTPTYLHTSISKSSKCANIIDQSSVCRHFREILLGFCSPTEILDWYVLDREDERPCHEQETQEAVNPQCSGLGKLLAGTQK